MKLFNRIAYTIATVGPLGAWSELGPIVGGLGFVFMWYLPNIAQFLGNLPPFGIELLAVAFVVLVVQKALLDDRVIWYGDVPVAPHIALDWFLGGVVSVHDLNHEPIVYAVAFLIYLVLSSLKPLGIRQARLLPRFWGVIADDLAAGALANIFTSLIFRVLTRSL